MFCQNHFLITSIFEPFYFLKPCPIFDKLSPDGFTKYNRLFFWPKILLFRTQSACFAKSKYSLTYIVAAWPYNIQNLIWMQYRKATIDVYSGRCGAVHHFSLKDAHSKVASPECCTLESKFFWSCILIFLNFPPIFFDNIWRSTQQKLRRHEHNYNK